MSKEIPYDLLKEYFYDKISEASKTEVQNWLSNTERNPKYESFLRFLWNEMEQDSDDPVVDLDTILYKIHHGINHISRKEEGRSLSKRTRPVIQLNTVLRNAARIAAIMLLPVMGFLGWEVYSQKLWIKNQAEIVYNEIICPLGSRSQFELPDGTTGSLNNGSRLKYPVKFSGKSREVELAGEAYFDVSHNKTRPFIISTDGLDVRVLGTRLNVYSYPGEDYQEFTLESGSIELITSENKQEITIAKLKPGQHVVYRTDNFIDNTQFEIKDKAAEKLKSKKELDVYLTKMKPGQLAVYELEDGEMDIKIDDTSQYTAWKDGKLVLRRDPMPILLARIERWYNVKFNILDECINEYTYWVTFEEENLDRVLELLSLTGPIKFEKLPKVQLADGTFEIQKINIQLKK